MSRIFDYDKLNDPAHYELPGAVQVMDISKSNAMTMNRFGLEWLANMDYNRRYLSKSCNNLKELFGTWQRENCLVVGAGPSATKSDNVTHIKYAQKMGWKIIAVNSIFKRLIEAGIRPDITFVADSQPQTITAFDGLEIVKQDKFAVDVCVNPETCKRLMAGNVYFGSLMNYKNDFYDKIILNWGKEYACGRSSTVVTNRAIEFCMWAGARRIAVIGNDLGSFDKNEFYKRYDGKLIRYLLASRNGKHHKFYTIQAFVIARIFQQWLAQRYPDGDVVNDELNFYDCSDSPMAVFEQIKIVHLIRNYSTGGCYEKKVS